MWTAYGDSLRVEYAWGAVGVGKVRGAVQNVAAR